MENPSTNELDLLVLLEERRKQLHEQKGTFAARLGISFSAYSNMYAGRCSIPPDAVPQIAKTLKLSEEEVRKARDAMAAIVNSSRRNAIEDRLLSAEELSSMANIARTLNKSLPLSLLLQNLDFEK